MIVKRAEVIGLIVLSLIVVAMVIFILGLTDRFNNAPNHQHQHGSSGELQHRMPSESSFDISFNANEIEKIELHHYWGIFGKNQITITELEDILLIYGELKSIEIIMDMEESEGFVGGSGFIYRVILQDGNSHSFTIWPVMEDNPAKNRVWVEEGWFFSNGTMLANSSSIVNLGYEWETFIFNEQTGEWELEEVD